MSLSVSFGTFNILADGLGEGEFMCEGGDNASTIWNVRKSRVAAVLTAMLEECTVVVTQENDHFFAILEHLGPNIGGIWGTNSSMLSTCRRLKLDRQFKSLDSKNDTSDPQKQYEQTNEALRNGTLSPELGHSIVSESGVYAELITQLYGKDGHDLFVSDDGLGIYYRKDCMELMEVGIPGSDSCVIKRHLNAVVVDGIDCCVRATLRVLADASKEVTVYAAHLKSGEDVAKEQIRCTQLAHILEDAREWPCPVILMDSNNSIHYEAAYRASSTDATAGQHTLSQIITQHGYVDAVGSAHQSGNECFKMRHGLGGQVSKHYQFMFDAIDKILVPAGTTIVPTAYQRNRFGFHRYDPALHDALLQLRTNAEERKRFEEQCRASKQISSTTCAVEAFGAGHQLTGLYPNPRAPSDHPPVCCQLVI